MLAVTFYKPTDYFDGLFNRFVTWMTSGEFCHCELVIQTSPENVLDCVKKIYDDAQNKKYHHDDCARILSQIEIHFFDNVPFRNAIAKIDADAHQEPGGEKTPLYLSFSLLWGQPMNVRLLNDTSHDSWFRIPGDDTPNVVMKTLGEIDEENVNSTLRFALEELGKNYDTTAALFSWIPWHGHDHAIRYEKYFCSEFIVTALQRIHFLLDMNAKHTTPNALFNKISI